MADLFSFLWKVKRILWCKMEYQHKHTCLSFWAIKMHTWPVVCSSSVQLCEALWSIAAHYCRWHARGTSCTAHLWGLLKQFVVAVYPLGPLKQYFVALEHYSPLGHSKAVLLKQNLTGETLHFGPLLISEGLWNSTLWISGAACSWSHQKRYFVVLWHTASVRCSEEALCGSLVQLICKTL